MKAITLPMAALLLAIAPVTASAVIIDFESFNLGGAGSLDVSSPLLFGNVGGSGIDVTMNEGADFNIYNLTMFGGPLGAPYGQALIDWNWSTMTNLYGTDILFSAPVSNFSLDAGDFGSDEDSPLRIEAFDEFDNSLGVSMASWPAPAMPPLATLSLNLGGIRRVHYDSGGSFPGSTFIDNVRFSGGAVPAVPEPASLALLALSLVSGLGWRLARRSRRRTSE